MEKKETEIIKIIIVGNFALSDCQLN